MPRYQTHFAYPTLNFTAQEELDSLVEEAFADLPPRHPPHHPGGADAGGGHFSRWQGCTMLKKLTLACHSLELPYSSDQECVTGHPSTYRLHFFTKH
jgi:hypothetical protein